MKAGYRIWECLNGMLRPRSHGPRVAFSMLSQKGPWGGSSVFVKQLARYLKKKGYRITYSLSNRPDCIVLIDPREDLENKAFGVSDIEAYCRLHPVTRLLHRINECDQRKGTDFMDKLLAEANSLAHYTVFISEWLQEYHASRWFTGGVRARAIYNGADPRIFHPHGGVNYDGEGPFRIVTHHWSDNILKGYDVYEEVDNLLAAGELPGVEFWVIGRWPASIRWKCTKAFPPASGKRLAHLLRQCHAYLTASRWEPCGMHHVEGAQCGLPLIYHEDGGGIVEAGLRYGIGFRDNVAEAILEMKQAYSEYRKKVFATMPSGDRMCSEYADVIRMLLTREP